MKHNLNFIVFNLGKKDYHNFKFNLIFDSIFNLIEAKQEVNFNLILTFFLDLYQNVILQESLNINKVTI